MSGPIFLFDVFFGVRTLRRFEHFLGCNHVFRPRRAFIDWKRIVESNRHGDRSLPVLDVDPSDGEVVLERVGAYLLVDYRIWGGRLACN